MVLLGYALAALMGLSLGLLGGGGSILTVPIFVYVLDFPAKPAIAMSLPVVGTTAFIGAIRHWRVGNVVPRVAVTFGALAMIGSYAGARFAALVRGPVQLLLLGAVMLAAAISMLRRSPLDRDTSSGATPVPSFALVVIVALTVGLLTGLVGIGGGFLIVPALVLLARVPMKQAVGTSLVVIAMNSLSGSLGYLGQVDLPWGFLLGFTAVAAAGILAGTALVRFVSAAALRRAFGVFLLLVGAFVLYQNRAALSPPPTSERTRHQ
jgi:uncharacterized protein